MRKIFALLALVLGVVSCQTEPEGFDVNAGGEVDTVISIAIPEAETRAGGLDSAVGAFENKVLDGDLTMRYICEVHYGTQMKTLETQYSDGKTVQFPVRLIPNREYRFVVWADIVNETAKADIHYNTEDGLENITLNDTWVAMDETRDAYFCSEECEFTGNGEISLTLKRPFAKLRVKTTDMAELLGVVPAYAKVEYTTPYYSKFNAKTGEVATEGDEKTHEFAIATYGDNTNESKVLFTDYFFATADQKAVQFVLSVYEDDSWTEDKLIKTNSFNTDIPVKRNYLTTIAGNILTTGDNITVTIDDKFAEGGIQWPDANNNAEQLAYAAMFGGEVTLTEDVALTQPLTIVEGAKVVIDLNGKTITTTLKSEGRHHYAIDNYGTLTLKGEGAINARGIENFGTMTVEEGVTITNVDTNGGAAIWNEGNITINGGTFKTNESAGIGSYGVALNTRPGGKATVNNGTFKSYSNLSYAIINAGETTIYNANVEGKHGAVAGAETNDKTAIYGGTFKLNGNPDNSDHCAYCVSAIYGGTFSIVVPDPAHGDSVFCESKIADGYKVIEKDGKYVVVSNEVDNVVASKKDVQDALKSAATAGETEVVIDANGANIGDLDYGLTKAMVPAGTTVTIRNAVVEGQSYGNGVNGTVIFEGCSFNAGVYSIHFDNGNGNVIFKNCDLYGWNSFGASLTSVEFENCSLNGNGSYALIRSYVDLTLTNCVINTSNANHNDAYPEGVQVVNSATLTENNVTYVAENTGALKAAVTEENATVNVAAGEYTFPSSVAAGVTIKCEEGTVFTGTSGLNINGATVIGAEFKNENGIAVRDYINGTFKNCTFTGSEALRWCYSEAGKTIVFENCVIKTDFRGFHFDGMQGDVIFRNCEINGFNAYGGEGTATFEGCTFGCDQSAYNGLNIYSNTNLINCTFNFVSGKTNFIDMEGTGKTLKITNCVATLDGANVDIKNYVGGSKLSVNTVIYE